MIEPEGDSKLSANIRKFEILKENIIRFYPKLKNCTIRTDFSKPGSLQSSVLECKYILKVIFYSLMHLSSDPESF